MNYSHTEIELATCALPVLCIVLAVALVAFAAKSRAVFVAGMIGSLLGFVVPEPVVHAQYSSVEAACLASLTDSADHVLVWGLAGATAACLGTLYLKSLYGRTRFQYSLRTLLIIVTVFSVIAAIVRTLV